MLLARNASASPAYRANPWGWPRVCEQPSPGGGCPFKADETFGVGPWAETGSILKGRPAENLFTSIWLNWDQVDGDYGSNRRDSGPSGTRGGERQQKNRRDHGRVWNASPEIVRRWRVAIADG